MTTRKTAYPDASTAIAIATEMALSIKQIIDGLPHLGDKSKNRSFAEEIKRVADTARLIGLRVVTIVCDHAQELADQIEQGQTSRDADKLETIAAVMTAVFRYVSAVSGGKIGSGQSLHASYLDLMRFLPSRQTASRPEFFLPIAPAYGPNSPNYNEGRFIAEVARYNDEFRQAMKRHEQRKDLETINAMRTTLVTIETKNPPSNFRMLLSLAISFMDVAVRTGGKINVENDGLLIRLDRELAGVVQGELDVEEGTISWFMHVLAQAPQFSARIRGFQETYELTRLIDEGQSANINDQTIAQMTAAIENARRTWESSLTAKGDIDVARSACFALVSVANVMADYALKTMALAMGSLADGIVEKRVAIDQDVAIFGASILVAISERLERIGLDPRGGRATADQHRDRVRAVLSGKRPADLAREASNQGGHVQAILDELGNDLATAEQIIDQCLRDGAKEGKREEVAKLFNVVKSALAFVNLGDAAEFATTVEQYVDKIMSALLAGQEPTPEEKRVLAESVMMLHRYVSIINADKVQAGQALQRGISMFASVAGVQDDLVPESEGEGIFDVCNDEDLGPIFFEEARGVVSDLILPGLEALRLDPVNENTMLDVRRGFHTLKGSARMVDLNQLGHVGQHAEYVLNIFRDNRNLRPDAVLFTWLEETARFFDHAVGVLEQGRPVKINTAPFEAVYNHLRDHNTFVRVDLGQSAEDEAPDQPAAISVSSTAASIGPAVLEELTVHIPETGAVISVAPVGLEPALLAVATETIDESVGHSLPERMAIDVPSIVDVLDPVNSDFQVGAVASLGSVEAALEHVGDATIEKSAAADAADAADADANPLPVLIDFAKDPVEPEHVARSEEIDPNGVGAEVVDRLEGESEAERHGVIGRMTGLTDLTDPTDATEILPEIRVDQASELELLLDPVATPAVVESPETSDVSFGGHAIEFETIERPAVPAKDVFEIAFLDDAADGAQTPKLPEFPELPEAGNLLDSPIAAEDLTPPWAEAVPIDRDVLDPVPASQPIESVARPPALRTDLPTLQVVDAVEDTIPMPRPQWTGFDVQDVPMAPGETAASSSASEIRFLAGEQVESALVELDHQAPSETASPVIVDEEDVEIGSVSIPRIMYDAFVKEARTFQDSLQSSITEAVMGKRNTVDFEVMRMAHSLAGMGRTTGLIAVTHLAACVEEWVNVNQDRPLRINEDAKGVLLDAVEALDAMISGVEDRIEPLIEESIVVRLRKVIDADEHRIAMADDSRPEITESLLEQMSENGADVSDTGVTSSMVSIVPTKLRPPSMTGPITGTGNSNHDGVSDAVSASTVQTHNASVGVTEVAKESRPFRQEHSEISAVEQAANIIHDDTVDVVAESAPEGDTAANEAAGANHGATVESAEITDAVAQGGPLDQGPDRRNLLTDTADDSREGPATEAITSVSQAEGTNVPAALDLARPDEATELVRAEEVAGLVGEDDAELVLTFVADEQAAATDAVQPALVSDSVEIVEVESSSGFLAPPELPESFGGTLSASSDFHELVGVTQIAEGHASSGDDRPHPAEVDGKAGELTASLVPSHVAGQESDETGTSISESDGLNETGDVPPTVHTLSGTISIPLYVPTPAANAQEMIAGGVNWLDIVADREDDVDQEMFEFFLEEADERFSEIDATLSALQEDIGNRKLNTVLKRAVHTLKGSSNTAGCRKLGSIFHYLEDLMDAESTISANVLVVLQSGVDAAFGGLSEMRKGKTLESGIRKSAKVAENGVTGVDDGADEGVETTSHHDVSVSDSIDSTHGHDATDVKSHPNGVSALPNTTDILIDGRSDVSDAIPDRIDLDEGLAQPIQSSRSSLGLPTSAVAKKAKTDEDEGNLKVSVKLLDKMVKSVGEINIARSRVGMNVGITKQSLTGLATSLDRMYGYLRQVELEAERQMSAGDQGVARESAFDALQMDRFTRLQELTRRVAEAQNDVMTQQGSAVGAVRDMEEALASQYVLTSDLSSDLDQIRQVRVSSIVPALKRVVRAACRDTGKRGEIFFDADVEIDRGILSRVMVSLEHILRNAVAHGIESGPDRELTGKNETGTIEFRAFQDGGEVVIEIHDDGQGMDPKRIFESAVKKGVVKAGTKLTDSQIRELIFEAGFSTAATVTDIAGRGVGLDVVRSDISAMGGRVAVESTLGVGTTFILRVPATMTVIAGAAVTTNDHMYVIPVSFIDRLVRINGKDLESAYKARKLLVTDDKGGVIEYEFWGMWQIAGAKSWNKAPSNRNSVLLMRNDRVALHIDDIRPASDFVFRPLGPQVASNSGLIGSTINSSGNASLVVDPARVARTLRAMLASGQSEVGSVQEKERLPLILVVDDSTTVRKVTARLLKREGFRHLEAENGMKALEMLQSELPDVILMDIEMPVMNGYEASQAIRSNIDTKHIPIIMITSRAGDSHRQKAMEIGVNAYLGKPYNEGDLMALVRKFTTQTALEAA